MNDSSPGEPPDPLAEAPGANGAATGDSADRNDSSPSADTAAIETLQSRVTALQNEAAVAKDLARRAQADLANVRRRSQNERSEFRSRATEEICSALLPVLDDLHRAVAEVGKTTGRWQEDSGKDPAETPVKTVVRGLDEGIRLVLRRFQDVLKRQGLVEIEAAGAPFDPRLHEAVQETPAGPGQREGDVVEVLRRGYVLDGRVIRPSTVIVASAASAPGDLAAEEDPGEGGSTTDPLPPGSPAEPVSA